MSAPFCSTVDRRLVRVQNFGVGSILLQTVVGHSDKSHLSVGPQTQLTSPDIQQRLTVPDAIETTRLEKAATAKRKVAFSELDAGSWMAGFE